MLHLIKVSLFLAMQLVVLSQRSAMAQAARPVQEPNFGNFETTASHCSMDRNGTVNNCSRIQLTQRGTAGLRIRFSGPGEEPGSSNRMTFIASHPSGDLALACDKGNCKPSGTPWSATVISGSTAQFNARGLPDNLPKAWPMRGTCKISQELIACQSQSRSGWTLSAEARL